MKHGNCFGILILSLAVSAAAVEKSETIEKTLTLGDRGRVTVIADEGEIVVTAWPGDAVKVVAVKRVWGRSNKAAEERLEMLDVEFQKTGNRLIVRAIDRLDDHFALGDILDGDFWRSKGWQDDRIDFELKVPVRTAMKLKTDEGGVEVSGTEGDLMIEVDEGDIRLESLKADEIRITVDEGDVRLEQIKSSPDGYCEITADESVVRLKDVDLSSLNINADEGRIFFDRVAAQEVTVTTDEGDMALQLTTKKNGRYRFTADEGFIEIGLFSDAGCQVTLQTDEGEIQSDFDLKIKRLDEGAKLSGKIGGQTDAVLTAHTEEGDILLRSLERKEN